MTGEIFSNAEGLAQLDIATAKRLCVRRDVQAAFAATAQKIKLCEAERFIYEDRNPSRGAAAVGEGVSGRLENEGTHYAATGSNFIAVGGIARSAGSVERVPRQNRKRARYALQFWRATQV